MRDNQPLQLFSDSPQEAYDNGLSKFLITNRNTNLGSLLNSERAVFYTQILYRMLLFRRGHELEPPHDDLYHAVRNAQEAVSERDYGWDAYNQDITQLLQWKLLTSRMEKERIRGYKDTRKTKYRYNLPDEAIAFLHWLEEQLQDDFTEPTTDARDLLEEICGTVKELGRLIRAQWRNGMNENAARRILFQIVKSHQITLDINASLGNFNARLLGFLTHDYRMHELRHLLAALSDYVEKYLKQIGQYREILVPLITTLTQPKTIRTLTEAYQVMESERRAAPQLFRATRTTANPTGIPASLFNFYRANGAMDEICRRVNRSALRVWKRVSSHLKELERKSHRLEDLRARMKDLSAQEESYVPQQWLNGLLSWGHIRGDMHEWDEDVKANPPMPRRSSWKTRKSPSLFLKRKTRGGEIAQSMEETRMEALRAWLEAKLPVGSKPTYVSEGRYDNPEDFPKILELAKSGVFNEGKKLKRIGYRVKNGKQSVSAAVDKQSLEFIEMLLEKR